MDNIDRKKIRRKRELTIKYMVAITLVAGLALSSLLLLRSLINQLDGYASVINISGRQRMLSQRTTLLIHEIMMGVHEKEAVEEQKKALLADLNLMERSHQQLISGKFHNGKTVEPSATISRMYYQEPLPLDRLVREHIDAIRTLLRNPVPEVSAPALDELSRRARQELLDSLDLVVSQYEAESNNYSEALEKRALQIFFCTIF